MVDRSKYNLRQEGGMREYVAALEAEREWQADRIGELERKIHSLEIKLAEAEKRASKWHEEARLLRKLKRSHYREILKLRALLDNQQSADGEYSNP